jgi:putative transcriptional regulator
METNLFNQLTESLNQAIEHAKGERKDLRTTVLPRPPKQMTKDEVISIREQLNWSQSVFAGTLNVSVKTVQAWEQGLRNPSDAALKLLSIAKKNPQILLESQV